MTAETPEPQVLARRQVLKDQLVCSWLKNLRKRSPYISDQTSGSSTIAPRAPITIRYQISVENFKSQ